MKWNRLWGPIALATWRPWSCAPSAAHSATTIASTDLHSSATLVPCPDWWEHTQTAIRPSNNDDHQRADTRFSSPLALVLFTLFSFLHSCYFIFGIFSRTFSWAEKCHCTPDFFTRLILFVSEWRFLVPNFRFSPNFTRFLICFWFLALIFSSILLPHPQVHLYIPFRFNYVF